MSQSPLFRVSPPGHTREPTGSPGARPGPQAAFRVARCAFLAGRRLEMQDLAAELGVSRATLFRWVGGKEQLLAEVVWSIALPTFEQAVADAGSRRGPQRIATVLRNFAAASIRSEPFMVFVQREPERALRLLTTRASGFHTRLVERIEVLLVEEIEAGRVVPPLPVHDLSFLVLRITETFVYADAIAGVTPDPDRVHQGIAALLRD